MYVKIHARLGKALCLSANATEAPGDQMKLLSEAMRRFCRSIELCDDYLTGYYGLKFVRLPPFPRLAQSLFLVTAPNKLAHRPQIAFSQHC